MKEILSETQKTTTYVSLLLLLTVKIRFLTYLHMLIYKTEERKRWLNMITFWFLWAL